MFSLRNLHILDIFRNTTIVKMYKANYLVFINNKKPNEYFKQY